MWLREKMQAKQPGPPSSSLLSVAVTAKETWY